MEMNLRRRLRAVGTPRPAAETATPEAGFGRRLEGPGAEARLQALQGRFARAHRAAERRPLGRSMDWRLAAMCLATFASVVAGGWMLVR